MPRYFIFKISKKRGNKNKIMYPKVIEPIIITTT